MATTDRRRSPVARIGRIVVTALVVGVGISQLILTVGDWDLRDAGAYWDAAVRLREGEPLYPELAETEASEVYRYAPWFAWAWVPLTYLPRPVAYAFWSVVLLAACAAALIPLFRARAWLAIAFFLPILVGISGIGNVQPLVIAALVLGVERRSGPFWIAIAASLKAVPILLILTYVGRGQWLRAALAVLFTAALIAPMLLYDLANYPTGAGEAAMLMQWPAAYVAAVLIACTASVALAPSRFAWLTSSTAVALAAPRFFVYDVTFLMSSLPMPRDGEVPRRAG